MLRKIKHCGPEAVEVIIKKYHTPLELFNALNALGSLDERIKFLESIQYNFRKLYYFIKTYFLKGLRN